MEHSKIKRYVVGNITEIEGPEDVAENLGIPYSTLRKGFRNKEGQTLGNFINSVRIEKAKYLLENTDLLIYEIAFESGFRREETAMRQFKRLTGMTMSDYRKNPRL